MKKYQQMESPDTPLFELQSYKDLFEKARHDLASFDRLVNSYDLFNYLCTINHLHDWVSAEVSITPPSNQEGVLNTIRLLCNRAKHFRKVKIGNGRRITEEAPNTTVRKGFGAGRFGVGMFGVGEPSYEVTVGSEEVSVLGLCKQAFEIWETFLTENHLLDNTEIVK